MVRAGLREAPVPDDLAACRAAVDLASDDAAIRGAVYRVDNGKGAGRAVTPKMHPL